MKNGTGDQLAEVLSRGSFRRMITPASTLPADEAAKQAVQHSLRRIAEAAVHGRHLNHCTAWGCQPQKALAQGEVGNGVCFGAARANKGDRFQVSTKNGDFCVRAQDGEALFIQFDARGEEALAKAEDEDACIDELLAFNAG